MTALLSDVSMPHAQPKAVSVALPGRQRWLLTGTTGALVAVLAATSATALVRAGDRAEKLTATRHALTDTKASLEKSESALASAKSDLEIERRSLTQVRSELSASKADVTALTACANSLLEILGGLFDGNAGAASTAARLSNCPEVLDEVEGGSGSGSAA